MERINRYLAALSVFLFVLFNLVSPVWAYDQDPAGGCIQIPPPEGGPADVPSLACLAQVVVNVINFAFIFIGAVTLIFLLLGSIKFIVSRGDQKAVQGARNTMTYAIAGAVLVVLSYAVINIFLTLLGLPNLLTQFSFFQP